MICCKEMSIQVSSPPPYDCGSTPTDFSSAVWTEIFVSNPPPCVTHSFSGASGTFFIRNQQFALPCGGGTSSQKSLQVGCQICNPTASTKNFQVTVNWDAAGSASGSPNQCQFNLFVGGVLVDSLTPSIFTGPFNFTLNGSIPGESSASVELQIILRTNNMSPTVDAYSNPAITFAFV